MYTLYGLIIAVQKGRVNTMINHLNDIEPQVKEALETALHDLKYLTNPAAHKLATERTIAALVNYNAAAYMHGYFNAIGDTLRHNTETFYTAATCMIHFKYYHWNEKEN